MIEFLTSETAAAMTDAIQSLTLIWLVVLTWHLERRHE